MLRSKAALQICPMRVSKVLRTVSNRACQSLRPESAARQPGFSIQGSVRNNCHKCSRHSCAQRRRSSADRQRYGPCLRRNPRRPAAPGSGYVNPPLRRNADGTGISAGSIRSPPALWQPPPRSWQCGDCAAEYSGRSPDRPRRGRKPHLRRGIPASAAARRRCRFCLSPADAGSAADRRKVSGRRPAW